MGDSKDFRKRLDALNRKPLLRPEKSRGEVDDIRRRVRKLRRHGPQAAVQPILYRRDLPRGEPRAQRERVRSGRHVVFEDAVEGTEVRAPNGGSAFVVRPRPADYGEKWEALCGAFRDGLRDEGSGVRRRVSALCGTEPVAPGDVIFMDLESTGLAGTSLFLIGVMDWEGDGLVVRQYFARDYSEESAVISLFLDRVARKKLLVSFNGKSFDVPYVRVRAAANRVPFRVAAAHLDLLHECRRAWRHVLPDCRLATLESRICGRPRHSDIPGCEIPAAYHAFVRTGNAVEIVEILEHNMRDLVTLADLMMRLPEAT